MLDEVKSERDLELLLKSATCYCITTKKNKKFFIISGDTIQDVTSLISEENIRNFIIEYSFNFEIFDYAIKNKIVNLKDIDYSKYMYELIPIINHYPKAIDYIDEKIFYKDLDSNQSNIIDKYTRLIHLSNQAAYNKFLHGHIFPRIEDKKAVLDDLNSDEEFSDRHKIMINSIMDAHLDVNR